MKRTIIIITILSLMPFTVQSQRYGYYDNGQKRTLKRGGNGTYYTTSSGSRFGYGPTNATSRNINQPFSSSSLFRNYNTTRSGSRSGLWNEATVIFNQFFKSSPLFRVSPSENSGRTSNRKSSNDDFQRQRTGKSSSPFFPNSPGVVFGRTLNQSLSNGGILGSGQKRRFVRRSNGTYYTPRNGSRFDLGLSTEVSINRDRRFGFSPLFCESSGKVSGRTSNRTSSNDGYFGMYSCALPEMAKTTMLKDGDGYVSDKGFMEPPDYDNGNTTASPLGDAVVPLLLLLLTVVLFKECVGRYRGLSDR